MSSFRCNSCVWKFFWLRSFIFYFFAGLSIKHLHLISWVSNHKDFEKVNSQIIFSWLFFYIWLKTLYFLLTQGGERSPDSYLLVFCYIINLLQNYQYHLTRTVSGFSNNYLGKFCTQHIEASYYSFSCLTSNQTATFLEVTELTIVANSGPCRAAQIKKVLLLTPFYLTMQQTRKLKLTSLRITLDLVLKLDKTFFPEVL